MISVIIPTMWKYPPFWDFAKYLLRLDIVSELIIINNDKDNTPNLEILEHPKVSMQTSETNMFVNPSWNYGALISKSNILCIINDDFICDLKVFYKAAEFITDKIGCICLSEQYVEDNKVPVKTGDIAFTPYTNQSTWGRGVLFFIHKYNWMNIPSKLLMCYGDDFVFEQCYYRGLQNYMIDELFHYHAGAKTTSFITQNGQRDKLFIEFEHKIYKNEIRPKLIQGNFNF